MQYHSNHQNWGCQHSTYCILRKRTHHCRCWIKYSSFVTFLLDTSTIWCAMIEMFSSIRHPTHPLLAIRQLLNKFSLSDFCGLGMPKKRTTSHDICKKKFGLFSTLLMLLKMNFCIILLKLLLTQTCHCFLIAKRNDWPMYVRKKKIFGMMRYLSNKSHAIESTPTFWWL